MNCIVALCLALTLADPIDPAVYDRALDEVQASVRRAAELEDNGKPVEAAAALRRAVEAIPPEVRPEDKLRFAAVRVSLAQAEVAAYEVDLDPARLERSKALLVDVLDNGWADVPPDLEELVAPRREEARALLSDVESRLAELEAAREEAEAETRVPEPEPEPAPPPPPKRSPLVVAGAATLAVGIVAAALPITGFVMAQRNATRFGEDGHALEDYDTFADKHRTGNALGIAGAVISGALVTTGAVLLGVGISRSGSRVEYGVWRHGLTVRGRF